MDAHVFPQPDLARLLHLDPDAVDAAEDVAQALGVFGLGNLVVAALGASQVLAVVENQMTFVGPKLAQLEPSLGDVEIGILLVEGPRQPRAEGVEVFFGALAVVIVSLDLDIGHVGCVSLNAD